MRCSRKRWSGSESGERSGRQRSGKRIEGFIGAWEEGGEEMWGMEGGMLGMACVVGCWRDKIRAQHFGNGEQVTYKGRLAV